ncbi:MAG: preprotein translocase subunit YajC [Pseudomonadaceae bacterium]|nr:preprotein translocase subunit YajC [Pseudomonadaceae bacterium]
MFISTAFAQTAAPAATGVSVLMGYLPIILIFGVFYFLVIRPQTQAAKLHAQLVAGLKRGDKVLFQNGLMGQLESVADTTVLVRVNHEDAVLMARDSVLKMLGEAEGKALDTLLKQPTGKKK